MHYFINAARGQAKACPTMRRLVLLSFHFFAGRDEFVERLVGQISNLRRISNPPGAPVAGHFGTGVGALAAEAPAQRSWVRLCCSAGQAFSLRTRFPAGPAGRLTGSIARPTNLNPSS